MKRQARSRVGHRNGHGELQVKTKSRRLPVAPGMPGRGGVGRRVAAQAGKCVLAEPRDGNPELLGRDTRRRCQDPRTLSTSRIPASENETMLAISAICPIFQNA
jgi:hypothetical protein